MTSMYEQFLSVGSVKSLMSGTEFASSQKGTDEKTQSRLSKETLEAVFSRNLAKGRA